MNSQIVVYPCDYCGGKQSMTVAGMLAARYLHCRTCFDLTDLSDAKRERLIRATHEVPLSAPEYALAAR